MHNFWRLFHFHITLSRSNLSFPQWGAGTHNYDMDGRNKLRFRITGLVGMLMMGILLGCHHHDEASRQLAEMDSLIYTNPRGVLAQLDSMEGAMNLSRRDRMHLELLRGAAMNKADSLFTTDSVMLMVADYYDRHGSANERMQAHYTLGCAYRDMGDAPRAVACYQEAAHCADTLNQDCDYPTLMRVHSQMAHLYKLQSLYDEAIQEMTIAEKYCWQMGDTLSSIAIEGQICNTLYNTGQLDNCIRQTTQLYDKCKEMGQNDLAALKCLNLASCYMDKGEYETAKTYLDKYETCSYLHTRPEGLDGNLGSLFIEKGYYYRVLGINDSALFYYYKALPYINWGHNDVPVFRGLQEIYSIKNQPDSIRKYTALFSAAKERQFNVAASEATKRMKSLYNYSVEQEIAQKKADEAERSRNMIYGIVALTALLAFLTFRHYRRLKAEKKQENERLMQEYAQLMEAHKRAQEDFRLLETDQAKALERKQEEMMQYRREIDALRSRLSLIRLSEADKDISQNPVVESFRKKASAIGVYGQPRKEDWNELLRLVRTELPDFHSRLSDLCRPGTQEHLTCILVRLGFSSGEIAALLDTTTQRITNVKAQLNRKLFGAERASSFEENLKTRF